MRGTDPVQRRDVIQICLTKVGICPNHFVLRESRSVAALVVPFTAETVCTPILQMGGFPERGLGNEPEP